jgi:hypothetical protein
MDTCILDVAVTLSGKFLSKVCRMLVLQKIIIQVIKTQAFKIFAEFSNLDIFDNGVPAASRRLT